jgi:hypothetical protein
MLKPIFEVKYDFASKSLSSLFLAGRMGFEPKTSYFQILKAMVGHVVVPF